MLGARQQKFSDQRNRMTTEPWLAFTLPTHGHGHLADMLTTQQNTRLLVELSGHEQIDDV